MWKLVAFLLGILPFLLLIHLFFVIYVARQARTRGYPYWEWVIAGFMSNSIVFAILLALLPDQSLESRRQEKKRILEERLRQRQSIPVASNIVGSVQNTSIGDMATLDLEKIGMQQSIGDQATRLPFTDRSIGDAATQANPFDRSIGDQQTNL